MKISRKVGTTSEILHVFVRDSSSTTGGGLTGLTNASSGLTAYYCRNDQGTATSISLVTMTLGTYTSGGFKELDATNMPGWYQFCPPNGVFTSGRSCALHLKGVTNMAPLPIEVELTAVDNQSATAFITAVNGIAQTGDAFADTTNIKTRLPAALTANGNMKSSLVEILTTALTETAGQLAGGFKKFFNIATPASTMDALTLVATATNLTNAPTSGDFTATMKTSIGTAVAASAVASVTGNVGGNVAGSVGSVVGAVGSVTGLTASDVGAIKAKTDNLPSDPADESLVIAAADAIINRLGVPAGASVSADVAAVKVDTGAIKTKTDQFTFTKANELDVNVQSVNDVTVAGTGATGDEWGPA